MAGNIFAFPAQTLYNRPMTGNAEYSYDVIVVGAGVAGLWTARRLAQAGFNVIVIDNDSIGGAQTLASQGMIHGGQKYVLTGSVTGHAASAAAMPARWEECFSGKGDIDLSGVACLSDRQVMWSAGSVVAQAAVFAAATAVNAGTRRLEPRDFPPVLRDMHADRSFRGAVYELPERVMDTKSLALKLASGLESRILKGEVTGLLPDGQAAVSGLALRAQVIVFAAGRGNEKALSLLKVKTRHTQRRPLRMVMVKTLPHGLYGHGIAASPKPRVTVTSHPAGGGEYVWYLGGNIAEKGAQMEEEEAIAFARDEMAAMFPSIDWDEKEWATLEIDRAEPFDENGRLPPGPCVHERGAAWIVWPAKLTFTPALADMIVARMEERGIVSTAVCAPPPLPRAQTGLYPWETATWKRLQDRKKTA